MPTASGSTRADCLRAIKRIVVKVGSAVVAGAGRLQPRAVSRLAADLGEVCGAGVEVVLVSSGAVACGFRHLDARRPGDITAKQAAAAIGQPRLMAGYDRTFRRRGIRVAQVLLTADDLDRRPRYLNARHTLSTLLRCRVLPIVNENDSVSTDEIKFGDNDHLSALVANLITADLLVMLSNVGGLYQRGSRSVIDAVSANQCALEHVDERRRSETGTGGMTSKVQAAALAARWGIPTVVAGGHVDGVVHRILQGESLGTLFVPRTAKLRARKRWIAQTTRTAGIVQVDHGARRALTRRGASLLPSGISAVQGNFARGAQVHLLDADGSVLARGLSSYSADEIRRIAGCRSTEIPTILGYTYGPEVVHRDDLVLLEEGVSA